VNLIIRMKPKKMATLDVDAHFPPPSGHRTRGKQHAVAGSGDPNLDPNSALIGTEKARRKTPFIAPA
jgi:hypothetical protein